MLEFINKSNEGFFPKLNSDWLADWLVAQWTGSSFVMPFEPLMLAFPISNQFKYK